MIANSIRVLSRFTQDFLGHSQSSLRDWVSVGMYTQD
jgi:hypothetical protein